MELASRWKRLGAAVIDAALLSIPLGMSMLQQEIPEAVLLVFAVAGFLFAIAQIILLAQRGQTIGKILLRIKIVRRDTGENGGFVTNVLLRGLLNGLLNLIPVYFIIDSCLIFREDRRCIHDLIAGTVVVNVDQSADAPAATAA